MAQLHGISSCSADLLFHGPNRGCLYDIVHRPRKMASELEVGVKSSEFNGRAIVQYKSNSGFTCCNHGGWLCVRRAARQALEGSDIIIIPVGVPRKPEVFKRKGEYDEKKLFGVTTLDVVRAKTF